MINNIKSDQIKNTFAGTIKEAAGIVTANEQFELNEKTYYSKADNRNPMRLKDEVADNRNPMRLKDEVVDIRDKNAEKINDWVERYEKQKKLAYWANINNIDNNQIILHAQESFPEIYTYKNICINIVKGQIVMQIDDQEERIYCPCDVIDISSRTRMKIKNRSLYKSAILVMKS